MPEDRSNVDVHGIFQKALQQGYSCWICEKSYKARELWEHAKLAHADHADVTNLEDEAEAKKKFFDRSYVPDVILLLGCLKSHPHLTVRSQVADDQLMQVVLGNNGLSAIELSPTNHRRELSKKNLLAKIWRKQAFRTKPAEVLSRQPGG